MISSSKNFLHSLIYSNNESIANENYSDVSLFFQDRDKYLDYTYSKNRSLDKETLYSTPISSGGEVTESIHKICKDLLSINAFTEALAIYQTYLDCLKSISNLNKDDSTVIGDTIGLIQQEILDTMRMREEYTSKRKAILAKYSGIIRETK